MHLRGACRISRILIGTAVLVQAATDVRKQVNVLDNQTTGKAVDALLNYETVALFNNQVSRTACCRAPAASLHLGM